VFNIVWSGLFTYLTILINVLLINNLHINPKYIFTFLYTRWLECHKCMSSSISSLAVGYYFGSFRNFWIDISQIKTNDLLIEPISERLAEITIHPWAWVEATVALLNNFYRRVGKFPVRYWIILSISLILYLIESG